MLHEDTLKETIESRMGSAFESSFVLEKCVNICKRDFINDVPTFLNELEAFLILDNNNGILTLETLGKFEQRLIKFV
jgi:hypothetical protein